MRTGPGVIDRAGHPGRASRQEASRGRTRQGMSGGPPTGQDIRGGWADFEIRWRNSSAPPVAAPSVRLHMGKNTRAATLADFQAALIRRGVVRHGDPDTARIPVVHPPSGSARSRSSLTGSAPLTRRPDENVLLLHENVLLLTKKARRRIRESPHIRGPAGGPGRAAAPQGGTEPEDPRGQRPRAGRPRRDHAPVRIAPPPRAGEPSSGRRDPPSGGGNPPRESFPPVCHTREELD